MPQTQSDRNRSSSPIERPFPLSALHGLLARVETGDRLRPTPGSLFTTGNSRLIDLRPRQSFEEAHIPGSCFLAPDELDLSYLLPPRHRHLLVCAKSVVEAHDASRKLRHAGYTAQPIDAPISQWPGPWESGPEISPVWEPSPLVLKWAGQLPDGPVVDLACGCGRDAVFMAIRGATVTGIDLLPDALDQARYLAGRHEVELRLVQGDVENDPDCWQGEWGTINIQRFLHRGAFPLIRDRLLAGGLLLHETFLEQQALSRRKPRKRSHLLKSGELYTASNGLDVLEYHEGQNGTGDWMATLVARKGDDHADR